MSHRSIRTARPTAYPGGGPDSGRERNQPRSAQKYKSARKTAASAWLAYALIACGSDQTVEAYHQSLALTAAAAESVPDCIQRHISEYGGADAVTALSCPGVKGESCSPPDLTLLSSLQNLTALDLSFRCISDARPIAALTQLEYIELRGNRIEDIRPLAALGELRSLGLANNALIDYWRFESRLPFSQWTQLVELNLDATGITNILPIGFLSTLEVLHLQNANLTSIRPIGSLKRLQKLYIDKNLFEDLSPLEGLTQLTELTASDNNIRSIEPLLRLPSLSSVSLDQNCVTFCGDLAGASCANAKSSCTSWESTARGQALGVPVAYVEELLPPVDFPIWTDAEVANAFELVRSGSGIDWANARSGCDSRANSSAKAMKQAGFPALTKVYAFGDLRPLTDNDRSGFFWFDWHVALAARTDQGFIVFDPALEPYPLTLREWYARLVDSRGANLNFSCGAYYQESPTSDYCRTYGDERGDLRVDEVQNLRGAICNDLSCLP